MAGNHLELLPVYDASIDRLVADIQAAHEHVHLLYYIFADDATGQRVAQALLAVAKRGVRCRVLIDSLGSKSARRALVPELRAGGVEVMEMLPFRWLRRTGARLDLRNHRKIAVIDGRVAYLGSQNIVNADFKKGLVYEELVTRVTGPVVTQCQAMFLVDRFFETGARLEHRSHFPHLTQSGTSLAQVLPSGPGFPHANNQRLIVALLHASQKRVVITTPYFIPDETLFQALQSAALRGVEVHLIVSRQADQLLVGLAQPSFYEELLEAGVQIHLYRERFLHAKHLSVDDAVALIGSSNMDIRSFLLNA
jgi:cardiolipin synthase